MKKTHVKRNDEVTVITGKWKGENAKIKTLLAKKDRVVLELTGLSAEKKKQIGVRTLKKSQQNPQGGMLERAVSVHISNVKIKETKKEAKKK